MLQGLRSSTTPKAVRLESAVVCRRRLHLALEEAAGADVDDVEDVEARDDRGRDEGDQAWDA